VNRRNATFLTDSIALNLVSYPSWKTILTEYTYKQRCCRYIYAASLPPSKTDALLNNVWQTLNISPPHANFHNRLSSKTPQTSQKMVGRPKQNSTFGISAAVLLKQLINSAREGEPIYRRDNAHIKLAERIWLVL
jgi:hypothetical protein